MGNCHVGVVNTTISVRYTCPCRIACVRCLVTVLVDLMAGMLYYVLCWLKCHKTRKQVRRYTESLVLDLSVSSADELAGPFFLGLKQSWSNRIKKKKNHKNSEGALTQKD